MSPDVVSMFRVDKTSITMYEDLSDVMSSNTRFILIFINTIIIILGLGGNGMLLYATVKQNALKMDKISIILVKNITVLDLLIVLLVYCPMMVTLVAERWVFGEVVCSVCAFFINNILFLQEMIVVCILSVFRLWMLNKPRAVRESLPLYWVKVLLAVVFVFCCSFVLVFEQFDYHALYDPWSLNCWTSNYDDEDAFIFNLILEFVFNGIPLVIIILSNSGILFVIIRQQWKMRHNTRNTNNTAVINLLLVSWAFIFSYVPDMIVAVLDKFGNGVPDWFYVMQMYAYSLNAVINPIIYAAKDTQFRNCVNDLLEVDGDSLRKLWTNFSISGDRLPNVAIEIIANLENISENVPVQ